MIESAIAAVGRVSSVPQILRVITEMTGLRLSLVAHVTDDRWTCCAVNDRLEFGLEVGGTLDVATTLCREVRARRAPIIISHASAEPAYCQHPTPKLYQFESYIAVPIFLRSGEYFGNVCALDARPIDLSAPQTLAMFQLFAELIGVQLDAEKRHEETATALVDARTTAERREQFVAVLGHDLRSPLNAITLGAESLAGIDLPERAAGIVKRIRRSTERMSKMVGDLVDLARGSMGGGIPIVATPIASVARMFRPVVDELQIAHPQRTIDVRVDPDGSMHGDPVRLAQLFQNLLGNALVHSPPTTPVTVSIAARDRDLVLAFTNAGPALPDDLRDRMFDPYQRGKSPRSEGLGLGMYIAAEVVRAHRGAIELTSVDGATTVTCTLPRGAA